MNGVIYARYSSDNQREESIEGQVRECMEFAERQGVTVIGKYIDRAMSAKTDDRPDFQRMIKDSAKHLFDVVIVWKLDRFARNRYDSARYKTALKRNGVRVISAKENISDRPEGILLESMLEGYAEYYSAELSEKVLRGMTENALKCKSNGSQMPYGYVTDSQQRFLIEPHEAAIVQELYTRYADGEASTDIMRDFTARGIRSKTGKVFSKSAIIYMLHNRRYLGEYRFMDIVVKGGIPQIISQELFDRVQARFSCSKKAPARNKAKVDYLLTTKLYCGKCGAFMAGESGTSRTGETHHYYKCSNVKRKRGCDKKSVRKEWIEDLVVDLTVQYALEDIAIENMATAIIALQQQENTVLPMLKKRMAETDKAISNLLDAIQQGLFNAAAKQRMDELENAKYALEIQIAQEEMQQPTLTKEQIVFWISQFRHGDTKDMKFRRSLIDSFVNAIYLYDDRIVLTYNTKEGGETILLEAVEQALSGGKSGSDLVSQGEPVKNPKQQLRVFSFLKKHTLRYTDLLIKLLFYLKHKKMMAKLHLCPPSLYILYFILPFHLQGGIFHLYLTGTR